MYSFVILQIGQTLEGLAALLTIELARIVMGQLMQAQVTGRRIISSAFLARARLGIGVLAVRVRKAQAKTGECAAANIASMHFILSFIALVAAQLGRFAKSFPAIDALE